jgi:hyperosmotically inducible periplasmic protein
MRSRLVTLGTLCLFLIAAGPVPASTDTVDDKALAEKELEVRDKLLEKGGAPAAAVRVRMDGTTAILTGKVKTQAGLELAKEIALSVEGVKKVDNRLQLTTVGTTRTGEAELADGWLESKVKRHLYSDIGTHARKLEVEAVDGVVSVRGEVDNAARRDLAVASIQKTEGVKKFVNLIDVKP